MNNKRTLRIDNVSRDVNLVQQGTLADTFWTRLKGLMGVRCLAAGEGLLIRPSQQVHTHFMRMPVDVLYVNGDDQIMDVDIHLRPWRVGRPRWNAHYVVEVPSGTIAQTQSRVGDQLKITIA
jgi:uncharacterized protein